MKKLLFFSLFLSVPVLAQNLRYDSIAIGPRGPIPFASIGVCSQPANINSAPCSPLIALCTTFSSTCTQPGTLNADNLGNFHFYAPASAFPVTIQIYGPQVAAPFALLDQNAPGGFFSKTTTEVCIGTCAMVLTGQIQLFKITLTGNTVANSMTSVVGAPVTVYFEISQDSGGAHTWTWPANSIGGCTIASSPFATTTQSFVWDGVNAVAIGPCVTANGPVVSAAQYNSTITTGQPPFFVASTTQVANFNSSLLEGGTWEVPGTIGSTTPNSAKVTTLVLGGSAVQTAVQGTPDTKLLAASTVSGTGSLLCTDANGGATTSACVTGIPVGVNTPQRVVLGGSVALPLNTQTIVLSEVVTFPSATGTYRADVRYGVWLTQGPNLCSSLVIDTTNSRAWAFMDQNANGSGFVANAASEISSQTYAASATATFTLQVACNAASTATVNSAFGGFTLSPNPATFLEVTPILSN